MKYEKSVGAVVFKENKYLLLKYGMGHWGLVKGNVEKGESKEETIIRELYEETGIKDAEIIEGFNEAIDYYYTFKGERIHKFVNYLLIKSNEKKIKLSYEHDDYKWLSFDEAIEQVDFKNIKKVLKKAHQFIS